MTSIQSQTIHINRQQDTERIKFCLTLAQFLRTANQIMVKSVLKTVLNTVQGQGTNIRKQNCNKKRKIHSPESSLLPSHKKVKNIDK